MRRPLVLAVAGAAVGGLLAMPGSVAARGPVDQHCEPPATAGAERYTPHAYWRSSWIAGAALAQTFTVGRNGRLDGIAILVAAHNFHEPLPMEVRAGGPAGRTLARVTVPAATIPVSGDWLVIRVVPAISVHRGDLLAIVLPESAPTAEGTVIGQPAITWVSGGDAAAGYAGGACWNGARFHAPASSSDPPIRWQEMSDCAFRTYVSPLPATDTVGLVDTRPAASWLLAALAGVVAGALILVRGPRRMVSTRRDVGPRAVGTGRGLHG